MIGMVFLAVAIVGVTLIVFSVLHGMTIAVGAGIIAALLICSLWWVLPRVVRRGEARAEQNQAADR
jgi:hypothetical protein